MSDLSPERGHCYLVGFMGAGKTTVGKCLAESLGWDFVDLDEEIEKSSGMSIREIFALHGEPEFRRLEIASLAEVAGRTTAVVATGGGTFASSANREIMGRTGFSVWLNAPFDSMMGRIGTHERKNRPMIGKESDVRSLLQVRLPAYRSADMRVDVGADERPAEVAARISLSLGEERCVT